MRCFVTTVLVLLFSKRGNGTDCPMMYRSVGTVCGTDGVSYPTLCELEVARVFDPMLDIGYFGKCSTYCKDIWEPVCGNDLVTYSSLCLLEVAARKHTALEVLHVGKCWSGDDAIDREKNQVEIREVEGKPKKINDTDFMDTVTQSPKRVIEIIAEGTAREPRTKSSKIQSKKNKQNINPELIQKYKSYAKIIEKQ